MVSCVKCWVKCYQLVDKTCMSLREDRILKEELSKPGTTWDASCEGLGRVWLDPFIPPTFTKGLLSASS